MDAKNYINLLEEIQGIESELIIFTTYSFDPFFFDHMLLTKLRKKNQNADILVLVDEKNINLENKTAKTGLEYYLIPFPSTFHPKLFIFCNKKEVTVFVGSHNLTLTGFTHNLELDCKIQNSIISQKCLIYIKSILSDFLEPQHKLFEKISKFIKKDFPPLESELFLQFINNQEKPMITQILKLLETRNVRTKEITIIAPFYSSVRKLVNSLHMKTKAKKINVCVQLKNHNLDVNTIDDISYVNLMKTEPKNNRPLHCKILLFNTELNPILVMGSPNFTHAAMADASKDGGNYETAVLMEIDEETHKSILLELKLSTVTKEKIMENRRNDISKKGSNTDQAHLVIAEYKSLQLIAHYVISEAITNLQLNIEYSSGEKHQYDIEVNSDKRQQKAVIDMFKSPKIGSVVWLSSNRKRVSNIIPIVMPEDYERIKVTTENFDRISSLITNSRNVGDLLQTIVKIFPFDYPDSIEGPLINSPKGKHHPSTNDQKSDYKDKILDLLEKSLKITYKPTERKHSKKRSSKNRRKKVKSKKSEIIEKRVQKIIKKLAKLFMAKNFANQDSDVLHIFLLLSIQICEKICTMFNADDTLDDLLDFSHGTFETMWFEHIVTGSTIRLFIVLIYLENRGFYTKPKIMNEIIEGFWSYPTSIPDLIPKLEIKMEEINKKMKAMNLLSLEDEKQKYSGLIIDHLWVKNHIVLWKSIRNRKEIVKELANDCFSIIHENQQIPFSILFRATIGDEIALGHLVVYHDRHPSRSSDNRLPYFEISKIKKKELVCLISEKIFYNITNVHLEENNGQAINGTLKTYFEEFIKENVKKLIFSTSTDHIGLGSSKNDPTLVNIGRLFVALEPKCSEWFDCFSK